MDNQTRRRRRKKKKMVAPFGGAGSRCHPPSIIIAMLSFFLFLIGAASSFARRSAALSTIAIAYVPGAAATPIACALLPGASGYAPLNCTSLVDAASPPRYYSSGRHHSFAAVAAGDGFLCAVAASRTDMSMQWWEFHGETHLQAYGAVAANGTVDGETTKRVYIGPPITALSAGDTRVCAVIAGGRLYCWRWLELKLPVDVQFKGVAVGLDFVCGLESKDETIRCFGNDSAVVGREPPGSYSLLAAGTRHACAKMADGGSVSCWGAGAPSDGREIKNAVALALGDGITCALGKDGALSCSPASAAPPAALARDEFVAVQVRGKVVCGVLMANFSMLCWGGNGEFLTGVSRLAFDRVLPGQCVPMSSCTASCGIMPGSENLCGGDNVICELCGLGRSAADGGSPAAPDGSSKNNTAMYIIVGVVGFVALAAALQLLVWRFYRRRSLAASDEIEAQLTELIGKGSRRMIDKFSLSSLRAVTNGFADDCKIGSGGFGSVYKATLADGRVVAIKRAEQASAAVAGQPMRRRTREAAFMSELAALSCANHRNIVQLLGYCAESGERMLVYEFMSNGTLHDELHKRDAGDGGPPSPAASWQGRLRLALDAALGIEYMHAYSVPAIIHRDIKSSNILLDDTWTAKVADFGLSKLVSVGSSEGSTDDDAAMGTAGTVGYMDPEYYRLQRLTAKSDVYSFGVVLLELLSGCKVVQRYAESVTPKNVVDFAVPLIAEDNVAEVLDPRLPAPVGKEGEAVSYVGYLAADCVAPSGSDRPSMTEVAGGLERALAVCTERPPAPSLSRSSTFLGT